MAAALLCGGLLAVGGGVGGLLLVTGHHGISPRPAARPDRPPAGVVAAPPRPATVTRVSRPVPCPSGRKTSYCPRTLLDR